MVTTGGTVVSAELVFYLSLVSLVTNLARLDPVSQWILRGLRFYVAPDPNFLEALVEHQQQSKKKSGKKAKKTNEQPQNGTVVTSPEKLVDQFSSVTRSGLTSTFNWKNLHMYTDYDVLFFILVTGVAMFFFSEMWSCVRGTYPQEMSAIAVFLAISVGIKALASTILTLGLSRGETHFSMLVGFFGFVISILFFQASSSTFEFQISPGLEDAAKRTQNVLQERMQLNAQVKPWVMGFQMAVALVAGIIAGVTVLAALRWSTFYVHVRKDPKAGIGRRILTRLNFLMPIFTLLLWIKPIGNHLQAPDLVPCEEGNVFKDCTVHTDLSSSWLLNDTQFMRLRIWLVFITLVMRLIQLSPLIQAFLSTGREEELTLIHQSLASKKADINIKDLHAQLQQLTGRIIRSLCVVAIQFFAPVSITFGCVALLVRKGNVDLGVCSLYEQFLQHTEHITGITAETLRPEYTEKFTLFQKMMDQALNYIFDISSLQREEFTSPALWRPMLSFLVWWSLLTWSITVALGIFYYETAFGVSYITKTTQQEEVDSFSREVDSTSGTDIGRTRKQRRKEDKKSK